ncbi:MAG: hypothetical protein ACRENK_07850 [Gemmatimonadaceae bacterium]
MKLTPRLFTFAVIALALRATPAAAQNNITQQKIGDFTYFGGTYDGKPVSGSAERMGNFIYYNATIGGAQKSWSEQVIDDHTGRS